MKVGHNKGKKYNVLKDTTQQLILKGIVADAIKVKSASKNNRLPHKYLSTIVQKYATACPWLKIGTIRNALYLHKNSTGCPPPPPPSECKKGGQPVGSTNSNKRNIDLTATATLNAVSQRVREDKTRYKCMRQGRLQEIIMEEKQKHNLPETVMICHDTIRSRIFNDCPFVAYNERHGGHVSPLSELEPYFCDMIIVTAKIRLAMRQHQQPSYLSML